MAGCERQFAKLVREGRIRLDPELGEVHQRMHDGTWRRCNPSRPHDYVRLVATIDGRRQSCGAHRLMAHVFIGEIPAGQVTNHRDGDKTNNRLSNLEICSPLENVRHARDQLGCFVGERNSQARLTERDVLEVRRRADDGERLDAIARDFEVCREAVRLIARRKRWKSLAEGEVAA